MKITTKQNQDGSWTCRVYDRGEFIAEVTERHRDDARQAAFEAATVYKKDVEKELGKK